MGKDMSPCDSLANSIIVEITKGKGDNRGREGSPLENAPPFFVTVNLAGWPE